VSLKDRLTEDTKAALRAGDKPRLAALRLALAAIKQREVDSRESLDDAAVTAILEKLIKQGRDAAQQFRDGGRDDLADKETGEIEVLAGYLPEPLTDAELDALIAATISTTGATGIKDMGKVMAAIKLAAAGRADMAVVGARVRAALNA
jgi:uncharacterized protein